MDPAIPRVLAQSLPAPRLPVSLWADSLASSPACTSSLEEENIILINNTEQKDKPVNNISTDKMEIFLTSTSLLRKTV